MTRTQLICTPSGVEEAPLSPEKTIEAEARDAQALANATTKAALEEIARLEASIPDRWVRDAALGDAYAIGKLQEVEVLLNIERAKL